MSDRDIIYKATRPDGTSFQTGHAGRIDYGAALVSGEVVRHPAKRVRNVPSTYLSVSVAADDCTGASWPCRLFRVEPVGRVVAGLEASQNKRAVSALRVVEELPAHLALGPNGEQVAVFIEACRTLTEDDWGMVAAAQLAAWDAARAAAGDAARAAAQLAARAAAGAAAWAAAWDAARDAARDTTQLAAGAATQLAAGAAAWAIVTRDLITIAQYDILTQPFVDAGFAGMVGR